MTTSQAWQQYKHLNKVYGHKLRQFCDNSIIWVSNLSVCEYVWAYRRSCSRATDPRLRVVSGAHLSHHARGSKQNTDRVLPPHPLPVLRGRVADPPPTCLCLCRLFCALTPVHPCVYAGIAMHTRAFGTHRCSERCRRARLCCGVCWPSTKSASPCTATPGDQRTAINQIETINKMITFCFSERLLINKCPALRWLHLQAFPGML